MKDEQIKNTILEFIDFLMPELTPYESSLYLFFLRNTFFKNNSFQIRIGFRIIGRGFGQGPKSKIPADKTIQNNIKQLEEKNCIVIGDTTRKGTLYTLRLPHEIPLVIEKIKSTQEGVNTEADDYFNNPEKRKELFEREDYTCFYCGEKVTSENSTLDHLLPQWKGGNHFKDNLKTACLTCNSIKSGKSYEEAAPLLLKRIQDKRDKNS